MNEVSIRPATMADAPAIAVLVSQLGYPTSGGDMAVRLAVLLDDARHTVVVAERAGDVVGMAGACLDRGPELDGLYGRITAIVVDGKRRGQGVGRLLIAWLEDWCKHQGAQRVTLTSGSHRVDAHRFYASAGYEATGVRFVKRFQEGTT